MIHGVELVDMSAGFDACQECDATQDLHVFAAKSVSALCLSMSEWC